MKKILIPIIIALISVSLIKSKQLPIQPQIESNNFNEISQKYNSYFDELKQVNSKEENPLKGMGYKPFKRWEYFWSQRVDKNGNIPSRKELRESYNQFKNDYLYSKNNKLQIGKEWKPLGPFNYTGTGVGRINAIAIHPTNTNIIFIGAAGGGIWKTTDGGNTWKESVTPDVYSLGINDIDICKSKPNVILAATGDGNGIGSASGYNSYSSGLLKSTDGGDTWTEVNVDAINGDIVPSDGILIYSCLINYNDASKFVIATNRGVFHSSNSGSTWSQSSTDLCRDLVMHPTNPDILYGAFQTSNSEYTVRRYVGGTWFTNGEYKINQCRRVELALNPAFPNVCYGLSTDLNAGFRNVFKTENSGQSWSEVTSNVGSPNYLYFTYDGMQNGKVPTGGQGWYDLSIAVSPKSKSTVIIGGVNNWKTTDGGKTYKLASFQQAFGGVDEVHSDQHILVYDSKGTLYVGNDGGIYKSTNDGGNWTNITAGLNITQYYKFGQANDNKDIILAGAQDNGTILKYNTNTWQTVLGGDGFDCDIDPNNSSIIYGSNYNGASGVFYRSTNSGNTWSNGPILYPFAQGIGEQASWVAPLTIDENNSDVYIGYQNIYRSKNQGTFQKITDFNFGQGVTINEIVLAPSNSNYIFVVILDRVLRSTNGGNDWEVLFINPAQTQVRNLTVNPTNPNEVWVVVGGYSANNKVFRLNNTAPTNISGDLPNFPVNCITYQKGSNNRIYIGTDIGIFTKDDNSDWKYLEEGIPQVIITELKIHYPSGMLRAATYGRGMWEIPVNDCNLDVPTITSNLEIDNSNKVKVCKGGAVDLTLGSGNYSTFVWSNGEKTKKISPKSSGVYSVTVYGKDGCESKSEEIAVDFLNYSDIAVTDENLNAITETTFCEGDSVLLKYSGFFKDTEWSTGLKGSRNLWVKEAGDYFVQGKTNDGLCETVSKSVKVTKLPSPTKPEIELNKDGYLETKTLADKYKWYKDGNLILGEEENKFMPIEEGEYYVEIIINGMECTGKSEVYNYSISNIKMVENTGQLQITPNPFEDKLIISQNRNSNIKINTIKILDILGKQVLKYDIQDANRNIELNLNQLQTGTYILYIVTDNKIITQKIIKNQ